MHVVEIVAKIALFIAIYTEVFFLITFLEKRGKISFKKDTVNLKNFPKVAVGVPCWNEEKTIKKTVESLLNLDYPKDKIEIVLVDDGSTDDTWQVLQEFSNHPHVTLIKKENGGKFSALNLALEKTESDFFACLDADSYVQKDTLIKLLSFFEDHPETMAVAPSVITVKPNRLVERAQRAEYVIAVYLKKMAGLIGGIHVLPGPFSLFRRKVFEDLGPYQHGHGTEDMEIAFRMQTNRYIIDHCPYAVVHTSTPNSIKKLYTQRVRWIYGFIQLVIDYRRVLFRKKYGNFAVFTLPAGIISIIIAVYLFLYIVFTAIRTVAQKIFEWKTVGFSFKIPNYTFDSFYINTESILFLTIILYVLLIFAMVIGRKLSEDKIGFSFNIFFYFIIYSLIAPLWVMKAIYNTVFMRKTKWR